MLEELHLTQRIAMFLHCLDIMILYTVNGAEGAKYFLFTCGIAKNN